jgi:hypothetical protein
VIAARRLWATTTGDIVEDGDPTAAFLVAGAGCEVPAEHQKAVEAFLEGTAEPADEAVPADPDEAEEPADEAEPPAAEHTPKPRGRGRKTTED